MPNTEKYIINHKTDIKERNFSIQFASEAVSMLTYKDKDLTENDQLTLTMKDGLVDAKVTKVRCNND